MACDCSSGVMRTVLFVVGFIFLACAVVLSGISIYVFVHYNSVDQFLNSRFVLVPAAILLAVGVFFVVASLIGFVSACKGQRSLFFSFAAILLLVIILLIAATVSVAIFRRDIDAVVYNRTENLIQDYDNSHSSTAAKKQVDFVQRELKCCGVKNYTDWLDTPYGIARPLNPIPTSCCKVVNGSVPAGCAGRIRTKAERDMLNQEGCYEFIRDEFMENLEYIAIAAVIFLVFLILGTIASCALFCYRREDSLPYFNLNVDPNA